MDTIQKVLIKAGRKDLAQEYYKKVAIKEAVKITIPKKFLEKSIASYKQFYVEPSNLISDSFIDKYPEVEDITAEQHKAIKKFLDADGITLEISPTGKAVWTTPKI